MKYKHTQIGKIVIAIVILVALISIVSVANEDYQKYAPNWMDASDWDIYGIVIVSVIYLFVLNMCTLTISIDKALLHWHFGLGFPRKKMQLTDIDTVKQVRNKWFFGFGIRKLISGGWLYNVHGLDAVEVVTHDGKIVRLGTDDPKGLARALSVAVDKVQGRADE